MKTSNVSDKKHTAPRSVRPLFWMGAVQPAQIRTTLLAVSALILGQAPLSASETDENLEASARGSYVFRTLLADEGLSVEVSNGTVTLRGSVETSLQRELAEEAVAAMAGVRGIDNQIVIKSVPPGEADMILGRTVKTILGWHRSARAHAARLEVKEGVVTLKGETEHEAARTMAAEYAAGIEGVREVRNELTLKPVKTHNGASSKNGGPAAPDTAAEVDDASIAAQARMALRMHRPTRGLKLGVEVREGELTLSGHAATEEEKDQAGRLCADIYGVRKVVNKMTPEPESTQN
jgi:hyperosmotically inducible protein